MQRVGAVWMPKIGLFVEINNNKIEQYKNNNKKKQEQRECGRCLDAKDPNNSIPLPC